MRIRALETVWNREWSNYVWVRVETDAGVAGLGETFRHPTPILRYLHDVVAPWLVGQDARRITAIREHLTRTGGNRFNGYPTRSVEVRAHSAVDLALWDLKARAAGLPLADLIGGRCRDSIAVYNTCAGAAYNWAATTDRARLVREGEAGEGHDDLWAQIHAPGELALSLLDEGITAMKVWPFDEAAHATGGRRIEPAAMATALAKLEAIRDAAGDRMDVLMEYHGFWHPAPARAILREVDAYRPFWHEDPVAMEDIPALAELRRATPTPIAGSESHGSAVWFRDALAAGAVDYVHFDLGWVGGLSEALTVTELARAHGRLIAPHDCTGPVVWVANLHLALSAPHALWLESVRAFYQGIYRQLVTALPRVEGGQAHAMEGLGLGTELSEELLDHPETVIERSD